MGLQENNEESWRQSRRLSCAVQDKGGMRGDLIVGRRRSDGPATMEERARKQRSGETALCGKLFSYIGWEGDQGEVAAGTKRDVSED